MFLRELWEGHIWSTAPSSKLVWKIVYSGFLLTLGINGMSTCFLSASPFVVVLQSLFFFHLWIWPGKSDKWSEYLFPMPLFRDCVDLWINRHQSHEIITVTNHLTSRHKWLNDEKLYLGLTFQRVQFISFCTMCLGRSPWWQGYEAEERYLVACRTQRDRTRSGTTYSPPKTHSQQCNSS